MDADLEKMARELLDEQPSQGGAESSLQYAHRIAVAALSAGQAEARRWQPIETAPKDRREVVLLISTNGPNGYVTDPWTGWVNADGTFARWPHPFPPTHWAEVPNIDAAIAASGERDE